MSIKILKFNKDKKKRTVVIKKDNRLYGINGKRKYKWERKEEKWKEKEKERRKKMKWKHSRINE